MGYLSPDMYYQPEQFGLITLGELHDPNADYDFNDFITWKHEDGRIFYAQDSGCSCPSPFEYYTSLDRATEVNTVEEFEAAVIEYFNSLAYDKELWNDQELSSDLQNERADAVELIRTVEKILENR